MTSLIIDPTDLLLISPEIKQEVDDKFHQPLLQNYTIIRRELRLKTENESV